jgi:hypothetical protein
MDRIIGRVLFVDGQRRDVFLDRDGRQYVEDGMNPVYGVWIDVDEPEFTSVVYST